MLSHQLLRTLLAVADGGSIAAGARAEGISPSLASRRVGAAEAALETRLFLRTTRRLQVTEAGQSVLAWARETLAHFAQLVDELGAQRALPAGLLRLACNEYTGSRYVLRAVAHFRTEHPKLRFLVTLSDEPIRLIEQGYDLVIHTGRLPDGNLIGRKIRSYRRILCATPDYLAAHGTPRTPADLPGHACLTHTRSEPRNWFFRQGDGPILAQPVTPAIEVNAYDMLLELALEGAGILRISDSLVAEPLRSGRLVRVLPDYACPGADGQDPGIWLIQPDRTLPFRVRLFAKHLTRSLTEPARFARAGSARL